MDGKVCLRCKGKTLLGVVNKLLNTKSMLTLPSNVLLLRLKQGEGDKVESSLTFKIFTTFLINQFSSTPTPWLTRIDFTQILLAHKLKRFPFFIYTYYDVSGK